MIFIITTIIIVIMIIMATIIIMAVVITMKIITVVIIIIMGAKHQHQVIVTKDYYCLIQASQQQEVISFFIMMVIIIVIATIRIITIIITILAIIARLLKMLKPINYPTRFFIIHSINPKLYLHLTMVTIITINLTIAMQGPTMTHQINWLLLNFKKIVKHLATIVTVIRAIRPSFKVIIAIQSPLVRGAKFQIIIFEAIHRAAVTNPLIVANPSMVTNLLPATIDQKTQDQPPINLATIITIIIIN